MFNTTKTNTKIQSVPQAGNLQVKARKVEKQMNNNQCKQILTVKTTIQKERMTRVKEN